MRRPAFLPHRGLGRTARAGPGHSPRPWAVPRGEAPSCRCPVPPGGPGSAGDPQRAGTARTGPEGPGTGPGGVCARWETGNSGASVSEKQLRSARRGAGGALRAGPGGVRPPLGLARQSGCAAGRGGIGRVGLPTGIFRGL